jgi:heptosyltransferase I
MIRRIAPTELTRLVPRRICLIKPSALGDIVQTLPLLPVLKSRFPDAQISWVINREFQDLIAGHPDLTEIIPFDRRGGWRDWMRLLGDLHSRRFDLVFDLQGLMRSAVMTTATCATFRVGLQTAREGASLVTNWTIPNTGRDVPAHARSWRIAEILGLGDAPKVTKIVTSSEDQQWAKAILDQLPRPVIAVQPGAQWETKRWPIEKFAELLERATLQWRGSAVILGSRSERPEAERLQQMLEERLSRRDVPPSTIGGSVVANLAGQTTLKQLAALLSAVDFAVSNDSGPMHLAAGLGTPTLGLFTCTSAIQSGPPGNQHELVSTSVACAASYRKTCPHRGPAHLACLQELDVERVWQALLRLVARNTIRRTA